MLLFSSSTSASPFISLSPNRDLSFNLSSLINQTATSPPPPPQLLLPPPPSSTKPPQPPQSQQAPSASQSLNLCSSPLYQGVPRHKTSHRCSSTRSAPRTGRSSAPAPSPTSAARPPCPSRCTTPGNRSCIAFLRRTRRPLLPLTNTCKQLKKGPRTTQHKDTRCHDARPTESCCQQLSRPAFKLNIAAIDGHKRDNHSRPTARRSSSMVSGFRFINRSEFYEREEAKGESFQSGDGVEAKTGTPASATTKAPAQGDVAGGGEGGGGGGGSGLKTRGRWRRRQKLRTVILSSKLTTKDHTDYLHALTSAPWSIYGNALCVMPWSHDFRPESGFVDRAVVWVQFPDLPVNKYQSRILKTLGNLVGSTVRIDSKMESQSRAQFAKVAVSVDLKKPLKGIVRLDGISFKLECEGLPQICFTCGEYGHSSIVCSYHSQVGKDSTTVQAMPSTSDSSAAGHPSCVSDGRKHGKKDEAVGEWMVVTKKSRKPGQRQGSQSLA
ncbi:hypothetical protein Tsubulata_004381 [Turnera subulata]|uniref:CCHC-type domain-containing protein n=1 Tax=Turnera subulata TaxID=218843 RepID=A0A9Q0J5F5_9ROSI|nr:hypothetical protein Tsubulata_004381 [Turnera subulata]